MKNKKYAIIQTLLILVAFLIMIFSVGLQRTIFDFSFLFENLYFYAIIVMIIFGPVLAIYFMRNKDNLKTFNIIFRSLVVISIIYISWAFLTLLRHDIYHEDFMSPVIYVILLALFIGALIANLKVSTNGAYMLSHTFKKLNINPRLTAVIISIVVVAMFSYWQWFKAEDWVSMVQSNDGWYEFPWFGRESIWSAYNVAFKRITVFAGLIYSSLFLILYALKDKNN